METGHGKKSGKAKKKHNDERRKKALTEEEAAEIGKVVTELRSRFVQIAQLVAQQGQAGGGVPGADPASPGPDLRIHEP